MLTSSNVASQCDETHPTCNNCKKSKRECLGYDPIFRQQGGSQSSPNIQPAPSSQPLASSTLPSSVPSVPSSIPPSTIANATAAGDTRPTNTYGSQPSILSSTYASTPISSSTSTSPNPNPSPSSASINYDPNNNGPTVTPTKTKTEPGSSDPALQNLPSTTSFPDGSRSIDNKTLPDNNYHLRGGAPYA